MKAVVSGIVLGLGVVAALAAAAPMAARVEANPSATGVGSDLITHACAMGDQRQQLTLIDPRTRVIGVYHVDNATGEIALKSVRNFHYDLQMSEFNAASPLPREIRSLLEQR
jgi:hypothetical protein